MERDPTVPEPTPSEPNAPDPIPNSPPPGLPAESRLAAFFQLRAKGTTVRTELLAGATTFVTMAYILAVNPAILSNAIFLDQPQDLFGELAIATAVAAAIATAAMGLSANYPFALAPGMGLNAFFAFSVVLGLGIDWRVALAAVFLEGVLFIVLTLTDVRRQIVRAIPSCLKHATAAGIGLFIAYIALTGNPEQGGAGLIVPSAATTTTLGDLSNPATLVAIAGILIAASFLARRVHGALLWGILATAALGWILQVAPPPRAILALPTWPADLLGQAFAGLGSLGTVPLWDFLAVMFVFLFVDLFDTVGTLAGIGTQAGYIDERGELPNVNQALMADAIGTTVGAVLGTSTVTSYIESASGIAVGGRTGLTALTVAGLFLLSIFFIPLIAAIPAFATAPALVIVGVLMMGNVRAIRWDDPAEAVPSFLTLVLIPLSFSIAEGLAMGFITYPLIKAFQGKGREIPIAIWMLAVVFALRFIVKAFGIGE
ncbi:permease [Rubidibacter lacunae KORDI 51-2]|uniref:Permease n=1 Tax=Rubidibacter lacunae KORDI 51-2 TaxID=582515 RepID=U5DIT2_9CHRO|nr:NCS2 family permease [Rubidibacter lacunae]ERN41576.1 permease [Rubidibacter lacunae KORDI 51-2]